MAITSFGWFEDSSNIVGKPWSSSWYMPSIAPAPGSSGWECELSEKQVSTWEPICHIKDTLRQGLCVMLILFAINCFLAVGRDHTAIQGQFASQQLFHSLYFVSLCFSCLWFVHLQVFHLCLVCLVYLCVTCVICIVCIIFPLGSGFSCLQVCINFKALCWFTV